VFDYGGVLCVDQSVADRAALVAAARPVDVERFWRLYWELREPYDRGTLGSADYWSRLVGRDVDDGLDAIDVAGWSRPYDDTLKLVEALAGTSTGLALLSNCPPAMAVAIDAMPWTDLIPRRFYSCRLGVTKPDPAVYRALLAELAADPGDVTFVDDRPVNVAAATALGLRGLLFTDPATLAADLHLQGDT
jgi:putative hydrolase of the HAD superfamily